MAPPLTGIKVVEAGAFLSAPFAAMILGDFGAEVVKVEPPKGDAFRRFGRPSTPISAVWGNVNRGKRSVTLDLKTDEGRDALVELLRDADIFICNWRTDSAAGLGLDDATLAGINPRLIRLAVTGYGPDGPLAKAPAFDTVVQGRAGTVGALGGLAPGYPVDKVSALLAVQSVLAALYERERTGTGSRIDVALVDAGAYFDHPELHANRTFLDHQPDEARNAHATSLKPIPTSDGEIVVAPVLAHHLRAICEAIGKPEWSDDLLSQTDNVAVMHRLYELFPAVTTTMTTKELLARMDAHGVPAGPCPTLDEHFADPDLGDLYRIEEWPGVGRVRTVRHPARNANWGPLFGSGPAPVERET